MPSAAMSSAASTCDWSAIRRKRSNAAIKPVPHRAAVVGAEAIGVDLETRAVVALDQLGHQAGGGMLEKVGRQIADADAPLIAGARPPDSRSRNRSADLAEAVRPQPGESEMISRRGGHRQGGEGWHALAAREHRIDRGAFGFVEPCPVAHMAAEIAVVVESFRRRRTTGADHVPVYALGLGQPALILEHAAEVDVDEAGPRRQRHRSPQSLGRLVEPLKPVQQQAHIGQGFGEIRLQRQRLGIGIERLVISAQHLQRQRLIALSFGTSRIGFERGDVCGKRLVQPSLKPQEVAQARMHQRQSGIQPQRIDKCSFRVLQLALTMQNKAHRAVSNGKIGSAAQCDPAGFQRLVEPLQPDQRLGASGMCAGKARLQFDGACIGRLGRFMIAAAQHQIAEIGIGDRQRRVEPDRGLALDHGLVVTPELHEDDGEVRMAQRVARLQGKTLFQKVDGIIAASELMLDDAEMVKRGRMSGLDGQELAIGRARLGEPAGLQMLNARGEQRLPEAAGRCLRAGLSVSLHHNPE